MNRLITSTLALLAFIAVMALAAPVAAQQTGTIIIMLDTDMDGEDGPDDVSFDFDGDLGDFDLRDDQDEDFVVEAGTYEVEINLPPGFTLELVECTQDDNVEVDIGDGSIVIDLEAGMQQHCTFHVSTPRPTPTPTATPAATSTPTRTPTPIATQAPVVQTVLVPVVQTVVVVQQIQPPRTGEAGLK